MSANKLRIAVENSTWNNIGDAFYQMSIVNMLQKNLDVDLVEMDGPSKRAFRPSSIVESFVFDSREGVDADHFVFSGPILSRGFLSSYAPLIRPIVQRGGSYSLISTHAYAVGDDLDELRKFFCEYPPVAFHSRDSDTFLKLAGISTIEMDGICFAFFVRDLPRVADLGQAGPYVCSSFHSSSEPELQAGTLDELLSKKILPPKKTPPNLWRVKRHFEFLKKYPETIAGVRIVRPVHGFYPLSYLIFSRPNSFISYNPLVFLSVYRSCLATITDRVHAGVAALSFGNPAAILKLDGRFALFENAPVKNERGWFFLDGDGLDDWRERTRKWIANDFASGLRAAHPDKTV